MPVRLHVHVTPRAPRDEIVGWRGDELLVRVTSPPEDGEANAAACRLIAKALHCPKSGVVLVRGETARHKTLEIPGLEEADVVRVLGSPGCLKEPDGLPPR